MNIVETIWFTGMYGHAGIVLATDELTGEHKAYLGVHFGRDEDDDNRLIVNGGTKITAEAMERVLRHLKKEEVSGD